jgi:glycosyltransferase involved in cell wall biosynthesis
MDIILHVSGENITPNSGMGRIEFYWQQSFEKRGFQFIHIGPTEIGKIMHNGLFGYHARRYFNRLNITPKAIIAHEPVAKFFISTGIPVFVESHGVERRAWEDPVLNDINTYSFKTKILFPLWRLMPCDISLRKATKLLLSNTTDKRYVMKKYRRTEHDIFIFKNGVTKLDISNIKSTNQFMVLFNGTWIKRKGINVLISAAESLYKKGLNIQYLLIGTGKDTFTVINDWPEMLRNKLVIIPQFSQEQEIQYLIQTSVFVLPSLYEGQPLSLLQAMAARKCCITTNADGQKDIIVNKENGLLIERNDGRSLADAIEYCYNHNNEVISMGNKAYDTVKDRNWDIVANEVVNFVVSTIENEIKI